MWNASWAGEYIFSCFKSIPTISHAPIFKMHLAGIGMDLVGMEPQEQCKRGNGDEPHG